MPEVRIEQYELGTANSEDIAGLLTSATSTGWELVSTNVVENHDGPTPYRLIAVLRRQPA